MGKCVNGHGVATAHQFCPVCGQAATPATAKDEAADGSARLGRHTRVGLLVAGVLVTAVVIGVFVATKYGDGEDAPSKAVATSPEIDDSESPSSGEGDEECTLGASACAYDNGIDFSALRADLSTGLRYVADPRCMDNEEAPSHRVLPGDTFECWLDGEASDSPVVQVRVLEEPPYYEVLPEPSVLKLYGDECEGELESQLALVDRSGPSALSEIGREHGRGSHSYLLAHEHAHLPGGTSPYIVCGEQGLEHALTEPYPGSPLSLGDGNSTWGGPVMAIQSALFTLGYEGVVASGVFDEETEVAVRTFQREAGLEVDGVVGPQTWRAIFAAS